MLETTVTVLSRLIKQTKRKSGNVWRSNKVNVIRKHFTYMEGWQIRAQFCCLLTFVVCFSGSCCDSMFCVFVAWIIYDCGWVFLKNILKTEDCERRDTDMNCIIIELHPSYKLMRDFLSIALATPQFISHSQENIRITQNYTFL